MTQQNRLFSAFIYALPALAAAIPTIPAYVLLPSLYGDTLGLGLTLTGLVFFAVRVIDMITDPLVGYLSDRSQSRKPWVAGGAVIAGIGIWFLFNPPLLPSAFYLFGWATVLFVGWTMFQVPYLAWGAELSGDYKQRSRITALREGAGLIGILFAGGLPVLFSVNGPLEQTSLLATVTIVLGAITVPLIIVFVPDVLRNVVVQSGRVVACPVSSVSSAAPAPRDRPVALPAPSQWAGLWQNRLFVRLLAAWLINGLANGVPAVCFPLFVKYGLGLGQRDQNVLILLYFACAVVAMPVWVIASGRVGKHRVWCGAMVMAIAAFAFVPVLGNGDFVGFAVICALTGAALGADLALPPAIQADVDDWDRYRFGIRRTGLLFALWNMTNKLAMAIAAGVAFPVLGYLGLTKTGGVDVAAGDVSDPHAQALFMLLVIYAVIPIVLKMIAVVMMWRFPLGARHQSALRRRLARRMF
ncbi:MFS transporter [Thalassospira mesophila]|uniref:MFS transporter n=1 Tax=Thalassospira mesophila TaxID=1293891 RepID=A0A1Y2L1I9_9PROT|nr:MFS transporter [Thalassospira mesophila]OSQ39346.1 MFS transporter [Thalassospira mesophila]